MKKFAPKKIHDLFILLLLLVVGAFSALYFQLDLFYSILIYLLLPSLYLVFREKKNLKKITLASICLGVFFGMTYNFIAEYYYAYQTNYSIDILNYRIIGNTPIADIIWGFLIPFSIIIFYEHFLDIEYIHVIKRRASFAIIVSILFFITSCFWIWFGSIKSYAFPYAYSIVGILSCLPLVGLFFEKKTLILKTFLCGLYFTLVNSVFEFTSLNLYHWFFPGKYLISYELIKGNPIPLEEIIFWILPSAMVFVLLYEFLFDDFK